MQKRTGSIKIFDILNVTFLLLFTIACIYPFYYIFIYSLSDPRKVYEGIVLFPAGFSLYNYESVLKLKNIYPAFFLSVLRVVTGTTLTILISSFYAYLVTKKELPLRRFFYRFLIISMYFSAGLIPGYLVIKAYGLRNNFLVYIIPGALVAFFVILIKTYIEQLPASLEESAMIDGASILTIFRKIILPLSKPILATVAVFSAVGHWNSWFDNYLYCSKPELTTLQLVLYNYLSEAQRTATSIQNLTPQEINNLKNTIQLTPQGVRMTITVIVTMPIIMVYPVMQRYFVKGIMMGAIKG